MALLPFDVFSIVSAAPTFFLLVMLAFVRAGFTVKIHERWYWAGGSSTKTQCITGIGKALYGSRLNK